MVFLGPTLNRESAQAILPATYLPPVSLGDVCDLVLDRDPPPVAIGIIDGYFDQVPAVWHKEILFALSRGVAVFGASSMGAIRASELARFGMVGVGRIFEGFVSGMYQDADVALLHGPPATDYVQFTVPMVDIHEGLAASIRGGVIEPATAEVIAHDLGGVPYVARTATVVCEVVGRLVTDGDERRSAILSAVLTPSKRADSIELLGVMAQAASRGSWPAPVDFAFEPTYLWDKLCRTVRRARKVQEQDSGAADSGTSLLTLLVRREDERLGLVLDSEVGDRDAAALQALLERFRSELT